MPAPVPRQSLGLRGPKRRFSPDPGAKYSTGYSRTPGEPRHRSLQDCAGAGVPSGRVALHHDRKIYICYSCSQGLMSSGEVTSTRSTGGGRLGPGAVLSAHSDCRSRRPGAARFLAPLLMCCFLAAALCGSVSADEGDYAPLWERGVDDVVGSVAITRDGSAVVAGAGSTVYLLDREGDLLWKTTVGSRINGVGISPEGSRIGVAADKLYLFDGDGNLLWTEKTTYVYLGVALSSNGTYIAAACDNGAIFIFDQNKKALWDYDMGTDSYGIAMSENGRRIALGCDNQGVYYLNSGEGESWSYGTGKRVKGIALTPDGRFVAAGSLDRCVYLSTGEGEHLWKYPAAEAILSTALTNEANEVLAASGRTVYVLDHSGAELQKITLDGRAESIAVTPDGSFLAAGGGDSDQSIHLFTRDAALIERMNSTEPAANGTGLPDSPASSVTVPATPANSSVDTAKVSALAGDGDVSIASQVLGWVENIFSLLFKPQEDFLA